MRTVPVARSVASRPQNPQPVSSSASTMRVRMSGSLKHSAHTAPSSIMCGQLPPPYRDTRRLSLSGMRVGDSGLWLPDWSSAEPVVKQAIAMIFFTS